MSDGFELVESNDSSSLRREDVDPIFPVQHAASNSGEVISRLSNDGSVDVPRDFAVPKVSARTQVASTPLEAFSEIRKRSTSMYAKF